MNEAHPKPDITPQSPPTRRGFFEKFLLWTTYVAGGVAAAAVGLPFIGFILGSLRKSPKSGFPSGRSASFRKARPGW